MDKKDIMPFHLFQHQGKHYVINIERMQASTVDETTAEFLEMMVAEPKTLLPMDMEKNLIKYGLIFKSREKKENMIKEEPVPIIYAYFFLTQSCNLKCIYCYGNGGEYGTGGNMKLETAFQAVEWFIEKAGKMKKIHLGFFGGEPFIKFPLMKAIVEYANKRAQEVNKEVSFYCTTNATLLDDEQIAFVKDHHISVQISIDGPREVHDAQRPFVNGKGSYDSIVPKIKKLLAVMPDTTGHAVLVDNTDPQLVKDAMQKIGFKKVSISPVSPSLFTQEPYKEKTERDTQTFLQVLEQEAEAWLSLTQNQNSKALKNLRSRSELYGLYRAMVSLLHNIKRPFFCGSGRSLVGISASGDVYLCHRFVGMEEYKLGSVFEKGLDREAYLKSPTSSEICGDCFAKYHCAGGCKHDNAGSCGSAFVPSAEMCRLRCRELELAAVVACGLTPEDKSFLVEQEIFPPKPCPFDF
jgi:uncharacterized protein